jgi:uncharacterized membrane protein YdjX (TVP38/TMEM64 family)
MSDPPRPSARRKWLLPAVVLLGVAGLLAWSAPQLWSLFSDPQAIRQTVEGWGALAPLGFIAVQITQVVIFALPGEVSQVAGGYLFGFGFGSFLSVVGIGLGSAIAFGLSRWLGVAFVHHIAGPATVAKFDRLMASPKFISSLFLLFLIPGIPKDILCYVAGLSQVKVLPFLGLSVVARLPGIFGSSLIGKALFQGDWWMLAAVAGAAVVLFSVGWWFREPIFGWVERFAVARPPRKDLTE